MGFSISLIAMTTKCILEYVTRVLTCEGPSYCTHPRSNPCGSLLQYASKLPGFCGQTCSQAPQTPRLSSGAGAMIYHFFVAPTTESVGGMTDVWRQAWPPNPIGLDTTWSRPPHGLDNGGNNISAPEPYRRPCISQGWPCRATCKLWHCQNSQSHTSRQTGLASARWWPAADSELQPQGKMQLCSRAKPHWSSHMPLSTHTVMVNVCKGK